MAASESELLQRASSSDTDALSELLSLHGPAVRNRIAGDMPKRWQALLTVDDVMQETYTDAFLDIAGFVPRGDGSFTAWLVTLAKNNLRNAIAALEAEKRGGQRRRIDLAGSDESFVALYELLGASQTTPSRHAARSEARSVLEHTLARLPEDHRKVVRLYDLEERPIEDVAAALDRRPGAVYMLRARAHRALRDLLGSTSKFFTDSP
ncbi:MAG: sigma-70 family RNA polymerase sigma factor [Planctomycetes bacterium]|nr:sigma-70 family RNA polymerase sigma factor [Planctomycetota bacterium]